MKDKRTIALYEISGSFENHNLCSRCASYIKYNDEREVDWVDFKADDRCDRCGYTEGSK